VRLCYYVRNKPGRIRSNWFSQFSLLSLVNSFPSSFNLPRLSQTMWLISLTSARQAAQDISLFHQLLCLDDLLLSDIFSQQFPQTNRLCSSSSSSFCLRVKVPGWWSPPMISSVIHQDLWGVVCVWGRRRAISRKSGKDRRAGNEPRRHFCWSVICRWDVFAQENL
jgi:hypothetical protein